MKTPEALAAAFVAVALVVPLAAAASPADYFFRYRGTGGPSQSAAPLACTAPWGQTVADKESVTAYTAASVAFGSSCSTVEQVRTCSDGILSGTASNPSCSPAQPASCNAPWGQSVGHGQSVTAYTTASVAFGGSCSSYQQTRTCSNGSLSGSATNASCSVQSPTYSWNTGGYGSCSATCGGGTQTRSVTCRRQDGVTVSDFYCSGTKPATSQTCNTQGCAPKTCGYELLDARTIVGGTAIGTSSWQTTQSCKAFCETFSNVEGCALHGGTRTCTAYTAVAGLGQQTTYNGYVMYANFCR